jgi:hypothetical protein
MIFEILKAFGGYACVLIGRGVGDYVSELTGAQTAYVCYKVGPTLILTTAALVGVVAVGCCCPSDDQE